MWHASCTQYPKDEFVTSSRKVSNVPQMLYFQVIVPQIYWIFSSTSSDHFAGIPNSAINCPLILEGSGIGWGFPSRSSLSHHWSFIGDVPYCVHHAVSTVFSSIIAFPIVCLSTACFICGDFFLFQKCFAHKHKNRFAKNAIVLKCSVILILWGPC